MEVPVVDGKSPCRVCGQFKLPEEMRPKELVCLSCYNAIKARNAGKPKPAPRPKEEKHNTQTNGLGWKDREEKPARLAVGYDEPILVIRSIDHGAREEPRNGNGSRVPGTETIDSAKKSNASDGSTVPELLERIDSLEKTVADQAELIASALKDIKILKEKTTTEDSLKVPDKETTGLQKLRNDLHGILEDRYKQNKLNGIYVHSLYGSNGRPGGLLNISKVQAFRLRDACRLDGRFKVEKAENIRGNWMIRLNLYIQ